MSEQENQHGTLVPGFDPEFGTRLKSVIDRIGSQKRAGEIAGVKAEMIGKYITGRAKPSFYAIRDLAVAGNVSVDWLAEGARLDVKATLDRMEMEGDMRPLNDDFVTVPRYDVRLAAGGGAFNERARRIDVIPFTREFLQRKLGRNTADGLAILEARGDSMEPTIGDGDLVLVDRRQDGLEDGIMAFVRDDTAYVKRIRCLLDGVEIISDNRDVYEPLVVSRERLDELSIIGRVRWIGRVLGR